MASEAQKPAAVDKDLEEYDEDAPENGDEEYDEDEDDEEYDDEDDEEYGGEGGDDEEGEGDEDEEDEEEDEDDGVDHKKVLSDFYNTEQVDDDEEEVDEDDVPDAAEVEPKGTGDDDDAVFVPAGAEEGSSKRKAETDDGDEADAKKAKA